MRNNVAEVIIRAKDETAAAAKSAKGSILGISEAAISATIKIAVLAKVAKEAFSTLVSGTVAAGDLFQKLAIKVDNSAHSLSQLKYAAERSGTDLSTLSNGLKFIAKNAADASIGTGEAKDAFSKLGVEIKNSAGGLRTAQELFLDTADALKEVSSGSERTALVLKIFGKSGAELKPLLMEGRAGIIALREEADRLGATFSDFDAELSAMTADSFTRFGAAVDGVKKGLGEQLMPAVSLLTDRIAFFVADSTAGFREFGLETSRVILTAVSLLGKFAKGFRDGASAIYGYVSSGLVDFFQELVLNSNGALKTLLGNISSFARGAVMTLIDGASIISQYLSDTMASVGIMLGVVFEAAAKTGKIAWRELLQYLKGETEEFSFDFGKAFGAAFDAGLVSVSGSSVKTLERASASAGALTSALSASFVDVSDFIKNTISDSSKTASEELDKFIAEITDKLSRAPGDAAQLGLQDFMAAWIGAYRTMTEAAQGLTKGAVASMTAGLGQAAAQIIVYGENTKDVLTKTWDAIKASFVTAVVEMMAQQAIQAIVGAAYLAKQTSSKMAALAATVYGEVFTQTAAIPGGIFAAPATAAAATGVMLAGAGTAGTAGAALGAVIGQAHDGMKIPREGSYYLDQGERVITARQETALDNFFDTRGREGRGQSTEINLTLNISADALKTLGKADWLALVEERILPALNGLGSRGAKTTLRYST